MNLRVFISFLGHIMKHDKNFLLKKSLFEWLILWKRWFFDHSLLLNICLNFLQIYFSGFVMYVVVGGGVAGVCCVQELLHFINNSKISNGKSDEIEIIFICGKTGFIKTTDQITKIGEISESFTVKETQAKLFFNSNKIKIIQDDVISWNYEKKEIFLTNSDSVHFDKLCIATGARPIVSWLKIVIGDRWAALQFLKIARKHQKYHTITHSKLHDNVKNFC